MNDATLFHTGYTDCQENRGYHPPQGDNKQDYIDGWDKAERELFAEDDGFEDEDDEFDDDSDFGDSDSDSEFDDEEFDDYDFDSDPDSVDEDDSDI